MQRQRSKQRLENVGGTLEDALNRQKQKRRIAVFTSAVLSCDIEVEACQSFSIVQCTAQHEDTSITLTRFARLSSSTDDVGPRVEQHFLPNARRLFQSTSAKKGLASPENLHNGRRLSKSLGGSASNLVVLRTPIMPL